MRAGVGGHRRFQVVAPEQPAISDAAQAVEQQGAHDQGGIHLEPGRQQRQVGCAKGECRQRDGAWYRDVSCRPTAAGRQETEQQDHQSPATQDLLADASIEQVHQQFAPAWPAGRAMAPGLAEPEGQSCIQAKDHHGDEQTRTASRGQQRAQTPPFRGAGQQTVQADPMGEGRTCQAGDQHQRQGVHRQHQALQAHRQTGQGGSLFQQSGRQRLQQQGGNAKQPAGQDRKQATGETRRTGGV